MAIFTEETQKKILATMQETAALTKIIANGWSVDSWKAVQAIVQAGAGAKYFPIGTQLQVATQSYGTLLFDVVAHDHHKNPNDTSAHTMTLLMHDVIYNRQFDGSEYMWVNTTGTDLAAGTFHFKAYKSGYGGGTAEDGDYMGVTTKTVPEGGAIQHTTIGQWRSAYGKEYVLKGTFTTYDASGNVIESGLVCSEGTDGTDLGTLSNAQANIVNALGTFNSSNRNAYGSNSWKDSGMRQWLNADSAANWWIKQTIFDTKPSYASQKGFLYDVDAELAAVLGEVDLVTARNTMFEHDGVLGGYDTTRDKVFLVSMKEMGFGNNNGIAEGDVLSFYDGATQTDRIKYDYSSKTTARYWWMRSPLPYCSNYVRIVISSGALDNYGFASTGYGCAAACVIM